MEHLNVPEQSLNWELSRDILDYQSDFAELLPPLT